MDGEELAAIKAWWDKPSPYIYRLNVLTGERTYERSAPRDIMALVAEVERLQAENQRIDYWAQTAGRAALDREEQIDQMQRGRPLAYDPFGDEEGHE